MRPRIKDENPDASFGQLGKIIGEQWSKLGADERKVNSTLPIKSLSPIQSLFIHSFQEFETLAAADKERYAKEMKDYLAKKDSSSDSDSSDSSDSDSSSGSSGSSDSDSD
jgi:structure-specific recognition protein 1